VRHPHVGHHTRPLTRPLGPQHARNRLVRRFVAGKAVSVGYCSGHADGLDVTLHACQVCRGRASRVGHLAVYAVGLHHTNGRKLMLITSYRGSLLIGNTIPARPPLLMVWKKKYIPNMNSNLNVCV